MIIDKDERSLKAMNKFISIKFKIRITYLVTIYIVFHLQREFTFVTLNILSSLMRNNSLVIKIVLYANYYVNYEI